jgi:O-antigen ligase
LTKNEGYSFFKKSALLLLITILLLFFFLTYCRAGWISFIAAALITWSVSKGISFSQLLLFTIIAVVALFFTWDDLSAELKKNKADSNAKNADIEQQTKSVVNITNDQSNAERLNRWKSALRMFADKPLLGFGPGTYQFEYLSYQRKSEMTRISVTSPYVAKKGKGGTAHSEYLLLLSECGILAFINWLVLIFAVLYYGIKIYHTSSSQADKLQTLIIIFGFSSYLVHGLFNNFLDTDKAAILFYSSIAGILSISIKTRINL